MTAKANRHSTFFRYAVTLATASLVLCVVPGSAAPLAYIPAGSVVSVVNTTTNTEIATIPTAASATNLAITPDGQFAYVSEHVPAGTTGSVEVIATSTNTVVANIPVGAGPAGIAVSPNGQFVYVCDAFGSSVWVIATATNSVVTQISVGAGPMSIVFSPDGTSAWVTTPNLNTLSMIDTATNTVSKTISSVGTYPIDLAVSPTGAVVYVSGTQGIFIVDIVTATVVGSISIPGSALGLAVSPDGALLYRTSSNIGGPFLSVVETSGNTVVATLGASIVGHPGGLRVSPDGALLYVSNVGSTVSVYSTATNAVVSIFSVTGSSGAALVFGPSSGAVIAPALLTLHPASVAGGTSATADVVLTGAAPAGGAAVSLSSSDAAATVPASVTVPAGSATGNFSMTTQPVSFSTPVTISAVYNTFSKSAILTVIPAVAVSVSSVSVNPMAIVGGDSATGTVTLAVPAPAGGVTVELWSNGSPAFVAASVTVPAGSTTATFPVTTIYTPNTMSDTITAFLNGKSSTTTVSVTPPPAVFSVSVNPTTVAANDAATGTVTLNGPARAGGTVVELWTSGSLITVPASVTIPAGSVSATFPVTTGDVTTPTQATVFAFLTAKLVATSITVTSPGLTSVSVFQSTVASSVGTTGTVKLDSPAPTGGAIIQLWTNGSPVFVPATVTIPAGATSTTFNVTTNYVAAPTQGTITAFLKGNSVTTTMNVVPISIASLVVGPPIQVGGMGVGGTVTLNTQAPQGGTVVQLWTNGSPSVVPASVTIPYGSISASFSVDSIQVSSPKVSTITAFLAGQTVTANVTITPPLALASVSVSPASVPCGATATGTVTLNEPALTSSPQVFLWTNGAPVYVSTSVSTWGATATANFEVSTGCVNTPGQGTITAYLNGQSVTTTLMVTH